MQEKIHSIQLLRFIAASMVVVFHIENALIKNAPEINNNSELTFAIGAAGVDLFFVISGFVMVYITHGEDYNFNKYEFIIKRILRIYPTYWICCFIYLTVHFAVFTPYNLNIFQIFLSFILFPGYSAKIIGPGWTLSYEMFFYIIFWLCAIITFHFRVFIISFIFMTLSTLGIFFVFENKFLSLITSSMLIEFIFGMLIANIFFNTKTSKLWIYLSALFWGIMFLIFTKYCLDIPIPRLIWAGVPSLFIVGSFVLAERDFGMLRQLKFISKLGDSSYSLYLLHILIIDVVIYFIGGSQILKFLVQPRYEGLNVLLIFIVCVCASHLFYLFIERRALRFGRSRMLRTSRL